MNPQPTGPLRAKPGTLSVSYKAGVALPNLIDALPDPVVITDSDWIITAANRHAIAAFNRFVGNPLGQDLLRIIPSSFLENGFSQAKAALHRQGAWRGTVSFPTPDKKRTIDVHCSMVQPEEGHVHSYVLTLRNNSDHINTTEHLEHSKLNFTTLAESLIEGMMKIDRSGTIYMHNHRAAEILGIPGESFLGKSILQLSGEFIREDGSSFPPLDFPIIDSLKTGTKHDQVVIGIKQTKGDGVTWVSINTRPIYAPNDPKPIKALATFTDITEIRRTNMRLQESEIIFRTFMKNSPTLGWIYDEHGVFVYGNPQFQATVGLTEDAVGKPLTDLAATEGIRDLIVARNRQVIERGAPVIAEDEVPDKNGVLRTYLSYWFLLPVSDNRKMIGGHAVEITDRKRARKAVDDMFERYAFAINASADAIWDFDYQHQSMYRNEAFFQLTGYQKNEVSHTSQWLLEKIHPEDQRRFKAKLDGFIRNRSTHWEVEYRFQFADGSYHFLLDKALAIYEGDQLIRVIGAMQDITERKAQEARQLKSQIQKHRLINQATLQAQEQERNRISGELHDNVNQLLMSAKLHLGVAKNLPETNPELLAKASVYISMAVDEIRNLSRKLNSSMLKETGLRASIQGIAHDMHTTQEIDVHVDLDDEVIDALDNDQTLVIYRIVQEQTNNILKYAACSQATITLKADRQAAVLTIRDNGRGFDTSHSTYKKGLGFTNMRNRIRAYAGQMHVESLPDQGCLLRVSIPIWEA
jgi:PAS domain S-box-containing protein